MRKTLIAAAALLTATAAAAQVATPTVGQPRDGIQTRAEAVQRIQKVFARADVNRDGFVTQAETQQMRGQMKGRRGNRMAQDGGGRRAGAFDRLDANRDNMISRDEWARAESLRSERMGRREGMRGQRMGMRGMGGGALLRAADANGDQRVSLQEATGAALGRFDRADANRDGRVTREERQQLRQTRRQPAR